MHFENIADEVDHTTWMVCPYCCGEAVRLERRNEGRCCPKCRRTVLPLCNSRKKIVS